MKIHIKKIRLNLGLTQEKFAEKVGISLRYLQNIEGWDSIPRLQKLAQIATTLNISIHDLIDWILVFRRNDSIMSNDQAIQKRLLAIGLKIKYLRESQGLSGYL